MAKTFTTPKGTQLPLTNLKGKDYLMVAYRLQWFTEEVKQYHIDTTFPVLTDEQTVCHVKVTVFDENGREVKHTTAVKRETKKDFPDHTEKAETGAIGRALAALGFGTQFALADLDEGQRLADSPLVEVTKPAAKAETPTATPAKVEPAAPAKVSTFRKNKPAEAKPAEQPATDNGWA